MALTPGTRLGVYDITAQIGVGGMGEVYRATDRNLKRSVAIKVLPASVAGDAHRLTRFQREAEVLAALNHPNIAAIYGLEKAPDFTALVMELVEGEDLSQRIARGAIPLDEALPIAKQIAEALEAAHEQGIIHRDLKPANIKVRADGTVKVLDFGLAKAMEPPMGSSPSVTMSPTLSLHATQTGYILGTAAYMSPEQTRGAAVDKRADLWALGVVLWEMVTGARPFEGATVSDTIAAVLKTEPNWTVLPADTPAPIRRLLRRCLDKDRRKRLDSAAAARLEIEDARGLTDGTVGVPNHATSDARRSTPVLGWSQTAAWAVAAVSLAFAAWLGLRPAPAAPLRASTRFPIVLPPDTVMSLGFNQSPAALALSSDGSRVVFALRSPSGTPQQYARAIDELEASPVRGTDGASQPFFSPDGHWVAFTAGDGKLKKVPVGGGAALTICDTGIVRGATWLSDDSIVFASPSRGSILAFGLWRVSASGGTPVELAQPDRKTEGHFFWPDALPGGKAILFAIAGLVGDFNNARIGVMRLDTLERHVLIEGGTAPHYLPIGYLVYGRAAAVLAAPFDLSSLQVRGVTTQVMDGVVTSALTGAMGFAVSSSGSAVYMPGAESITTSALTWVDRKGGLQPINAPLQNYEFPRLSPDGQRLAVSISGSRSSAQRDVWVYNFSRGTTSRLTVENEEAETAVWSPDGRRLTYSVSRSPGRAVVSKLADGSGTDEVLATTERHLHLGEWSPRGDALVSAATGNGPDGGSLWILQMNPKPALRSFIKTRFLVQAPAISPDGRWIAYAANDTNRFEVYVQPFPDLGAKYQVSTDGGSEPRWARTGGELFFRNGDKMMAVVILGQGENLKIGPPTLLFTGHFATESGVVFDAWYDVSQDGRFLMLKPSETQRTNSIVMIQDWANDLKHRMPTK